MKPTIEEIRKEVLESNRCVMLEDQAEKDCYVAYLNYKVVRALYELAEESAPPHITWNDCIVLITGAGQIRDAAFKVLKQAFIRFFNTGWFNFNAQTPTFISDDDPGVEDGVIKSVRFFLPDAGRALIDWFFLQAEVIHYTEQLYTGKTSSWNEYTAELLRKGKLWEKLRSGFQDALDRIDFRDAWVAEIEAGNVF